MMLEEAGSAAEPYYVRNFHLLADTVLARDAGLFSAEEKGLLDSIRFLPDEAHRLLLRLAGRMEGWLRRSRMHYREVTRLDEALAQLTTAGWLHRWPDGASPAPMDVLTKLTRAELRHVLSRTGQPNTGRAAMDREILRAMLAGNARQRVDAFAAAAAVREPMPLQLGLWPESPDAELLLAEMDSWVCLRQPLLFKLLALLFFGNRRQDINQFIVADLGLQRFEAVQPDAAGLFADRAEADSLLSEGQALDTLQQSQEELRRELKGWRPGDFLPQATARNARELLASFWRNAKRVEPGSIIVDSPLCGAAQLHRVRLRNLVDGAALLERLGRPAAAARWQSQALQSGLAGRSLDQVLIRLVINLRRAGELARALDSAENALAMISSPLTRHELLTRLGRAPELRQPPRESWSALRHPGHLRGRTPLQGASAPVLTVEELVLERHIAAGWQGLHAENVLWRALAGLATWDLIFAPVSGAFLHGFQAAPLDWAQPDFLERRVELWRRLRRSLLRNHHRRNIARRLDLKSGLLNPLVSWHHLMDHEHASTWRRGLFVLLEQVSGRVLAAFLERLLADPRQMGHGLPDLLLWREDEHGRVQEWRMVEVKGPGDRLFTAQRLWLDWLLEQELPVQLIQVGESWQPDGLEHSIGTQ